MKGASEELFTPMVHLMLQKRRKGFSCWTPAVVLDQGMGSEDGMRSGWDPKEVNPEDLDEISQPDTQFT